MPMNAPPILMLGVGGVNGGGVRFLEFRELLQRGVCSARLAGRVTGMG